LQPLVSAPEMLGPAALQERFSRSIGELGHAVSALQARSRSQEARISELAGTRGDVSARGRRGANEDNGATLRQLAAKLEHQGRACDDRLRSLEGRWEALSETADAAAAAASAAAAEATAAAASAASAAAAGQHSAAGRARPGSAGALSSARTLEARSHSADGRMQLLEETVTSLRARIDLLEAQHLNKLVTAGTGRDMDHQEVRNAQSLAENAHKRLSEIEGQLRRQQRELVEGVSQLQSEMGMSLKLVRVDAARAEGALEAKLEELTDRLKSKAEQVGQDLTAQLSTCDNLTDRLLGRMPSPRYERDDRARPLDARAVEASVHATRKALSTLEGNLRAVCEQQQTFDLQVTRIMTSVKACGEEQERLSRKAVDQDSWVRETVKSEINEFRNTEERLSRRAADDGSWLRETVKSEVSQLRGTEELLSRRIADRDAWLRETLMSEVGEFRRAEEDRYRDATLTAEHALAECSQRIRSIGAELEKELGAERGETLRSLAALEGRLDALAAERSQGISSIEARLNSLVTERSLGRSEARSIAALEARLEALAVERTSVQAEATSGVATLEVHMDGMASRVAGLEARLTRHVEEALGQADEATAVARAAEETAQRGEADSRASTARLEAKLEAWLEARRDMMRDARGELGRVAHEVAEVQARSFGVRAEEEAEVASRIARRAESAVRQLRENEGEVAGQWMRAEANLSERLMRFSSDEAISAGRVAQRTENALGQLQKQMQDLAVSTNQKCTAAEGMEARCDAWVGDLTAAIGKLREECSATVDRAQARCDSQWGELTAAIDKVREECIRRLRESQAISERAAVSARDGTQAVARNEIATAIGLVRSEVEERLRKLEEKISNTQNLRAGEALRQLEEKISTTQNLRAGEVREHLASIAEQVTLFESRLAPEALARLVRREVELATREAVQEEFRGQMRSGWFQQADFKFDCTLQCLHVLYLKGSISPSGALATLQRAVRGGDLDSVDGHGLAGRDLREESAGDVALGRPPHSPGARSGSAGFASSSPSRGLPSTSAATGPSGSGSGARPSASPARPLSARGPSTIVAGHSAGPSVPGGPGGRDGRSTGSSQAWARSSSLASPRGSSPAPTVRRTPRGGLGATAPLGLGSGRPRRNVADYSLIE